jgi:hypothetical protein
MFVEQVVWNSPQDLEGNTHLFLSLGYTLAEIEAILRNPRNEVQRLEGQDASDLMGITYGVSSSGERIGVIWVFECGNPVQIAPVGVVPWRE